MMTTMINFFVIGFAVFAILFGLASFSPDDMAYIMQFGFRIIAIVCFLLSIGSYQFHAIIRKG